MRSGRLLRKSELAGWRTKSLLPASRYYFLPIIKLRGLPFYSRDEDVFDWLKGYGFDKGADVEDLVMIQEVDSEINSGFALVTFKTMESARRAWQVMHKKPITKRFVEVFCLLPPYCPLAKRCSTNIGPDDHDICDEIRSGAGESRPGPTFDAVDRNVVIRVGACGDAGAAGAGGTSFGTASASVCAFCSAQFNQHADHGQASLDALHTLVDRQLRGELPKGLMNTQYLNVPALVYREINQASIFDLQLYNPRSWSRTADYGSGAAASPTAGRKRSPPCYRNSSPGRDRFAGERERRKFSSGAYRSGGYNSSASHPDCERCEDAAAEEETERYLESMVYKSHSCEYLDLIKSMASYNIRTLLLALYRTVNMHKSITLACLANYLSLQARAYLFITETKLQTLLQQYNHFFALKFENNGLLVSVQPGMTDYTIKSIGSGELTRKKRKGLERSVSAKIANLAAVASRGGQNSPSRGSSTTTTPSPSRRRARQQQQQGIGIRHHSPKMQGRDAHPREISASRELPSLLRATPFHCSYLDEEVKKEQCGSNDYSSNLLGLHGGHHGSLNTEEDFGGLLTEIIRGTSTRETDQTPQWFGAYAELSLERSVTCPPQGCENAFF